MCKNLPNCPHGDRCNYAHSQAELRTEVPLSDSGLPVPIPTSARPDMASSWESTPRVIGPGSSSMSFSGHPGQGIFFRHFKMIMKVKFYVFFQLHPRHHLRSTKRNCATGS